MIKTCERCGGLFSTDPHEGFAGTPCECGVPKSGECKECNGNGRVQMLEHCPKCNGTGREYEPMTVAGIIIPSKPPPCVVEALRNFVCAIERYDKDGVWPDNPTLRRLADEGREALNCGHSSNDQRSAMSATQTTPPSTNGAAGAHSLNQLDMRAGGSAACEAQPSSRSERNPDCGQPHSQRSLHRLELPLRAASLSAHIND